MHNTKNNSDWSGSKIFDLVQVNILWFGLGQVSHLWFGFEFGKYPLKMSNFSIFSLQHQKKISSGRVKKYPGQPLIFCGSKVSSNRVRSGHGPSLKNNLLNLVILLLFSTTIWRIYFFQVIWDVWKCLCWSKLCYRRQELCCSSG